MSSYAPIALFVYNRPEHTKKTVEALLNNKEASNSKLFIFSDAAKDPSDQPMVNEVRQYIHQLQGFSEINIIQRDVNWGLANSIIDGVTKLCKNYGRVIVLEDDLLISPYFLSYMSNALRQYENEERVMQIAGYMFPVDIACDEDALFLSFISSWGWATWQRSWKNFDPDAMGYKLLKKDLTLRNRFDLDGHYSYFKMLRAQQQGKSESWAIRWYLSVFFKKGLTLYPKKTLVSNLGFDGSGVNCVVSTIEESQIDMNFHVCKMPDIISVSDAQNTVLENLPTPQVSLVSIFNRLFGRLKHIFN